MSGIPCLKDGIAVLALGNQSHGTAGEIDQYHPLSCLFQRFQSKALNLGQLNAFAVAATEAGNLHWHFFAFQTGRYAAGKDDHFGIAYNVKHGIDVKRGLLCVVAHLIIYILVGRDACLHPFVQRNGVAGKTVVVAPLHGGVVGVWTNQSHLCAGFQGQYALVVLKQYEAFARHLKCQVLVFLAVDDSGRNAVPWSGCIHLTQFKAGFHQSDKGTVNVFFLYFTFV